MDTVSINLALNNKAIDSLLQNTSDICKHTNPSLWNSSPMEHFLNGSNLAAALITIVTVILIYYEFKKTKTSKSCQKLIIEDLIRHFWSNNILIECIRIKMNEPKYSCYYPDESIFKRFCVLPEDLNFGRFSVSYKNFDTLHRIELKMRNYNITAETVCEHFCSMAIDQEVKLHDLEELYNRSIELTELLVKLASSLNLKISTIDSIITKSNLHKLKAKENENKFADIKIAERQDWFYDKHKLKDFSDNFIKLNYNKVYMIRHNIEA